MISLFADVEKTTIQKEVYFTDKEELKREFIQTAQTNQCSLDIEMYEQHIPIIVPDALVPDVDLHWHQVGKGEINLSMDNITEQKVDVIAVFTNFDQLRQSILNAAGTTVEHEYQSQQKAAHKLIITGPGKLKCKAILFLTWLEDGGIMVTRLLSIFACVQSAIAYAFKTNYTSIAFSASGANDFDQSLKDIAAGMISGSVKSLKEHQSQSLSISFVLDQQTVYDAFFRALNRHLAKNDGPPVRDQLERTAVAQLFDDLNLPLPSIFNQQNNKIDVREWSTKHVKTYYKFCLRRNVLPKLDIKDAKIELQGPPDGVREAEIHFYEQCNDALKQTKLPDSWDRTNKSLCIALQIGSPEFIKISEQFNASIEGKCQQIIRIDRIQNIGAYKLYSAYRGELQTRYNGNFEEKLLFHGCPDMSAMLIIKDRFNRSYAGINGIVYGAGCYFSTTSTYSHSYTNPNASGDRCMFLVRVLVGNSTLGNSAMKTPPTGYDTTTNATKSIYVTYHDAQSYPEYLIWYK